MVATVIDVLQVSFSFPMEMHLVHIAHTLDKENKSATDPDNVPDGLAVLGFLFEVGEQCVGNQRNLNRLQIILIGLKWGLGWLGWSKKKRIFEI